MGVEEIRKIKDQADQPKEEKVYRIPRVSKKRAAKIAEEKKARGNEPTELQKFFSRCIKLMTGRCRETGLPTSKFPYKIAICSICHILPQESCKSVRTHPQNWIELEKDFHKKFDAMSWEEREQLKCWPEIRDKLVLVWPDLAPSERRHFPESVLSWMEQNDVFVG